MDTKLLVISDFKFKDTYFFSYLNNHINYLTSITLINPDSNKMDLLENVYNIENFHDLTIKIEELLPQILLYVCPLYSSSLIKSDLELSFLAYTELINHLIDISLLGNYFIVLIRSSESHTNELEEQYQVGIENLIKYSKSLIIETNYKNFEDEIKSQILFDRIKKGKNNNEKLIIIN